MFFFLQTRQTETTITMSGGSLSSRVQNMKFMQSAGDKQRKAAKEAAESQETKKLKDISEWSLPVNSKTLKLIKVKGKKIRKVGYTTISSMGAVNTISSDGIVGRKQMSAPVEEPTKLKRAQESPDVETDDKNEEKNIDLEELQGNPKKKAKNSKKEKKSKKKSNVMDVFKVDEEKDFDPTEVDLTSKSLLDLWKSKKK